MRQFIDDILNWYFGLSSFEESSSLHQNWRLEASWNWQTLPVLSCVLFAVILAVWLLRSSLLRYSTKLFTLLLSIRLAIFALLLLVLLQVQLKTIIFGKPEIVFLVDSSVSMSLQDKYDTTETKLFKQIGITRLSESRVQILKELFKKSDGDWLPTLEENYTIEVHTFDSRLHSANPDLEKVNSTINRTENGESIAEVISRIQAKGSATDFKRSFEEITNQLSQKVPTALILFTDGKSTVHSNASMTQIEKKLQRMKLPVYSVGLGVPANSLDLVLKSIEFEPVGFSGDEHPLTVTISSNELIPGTIQLIAREIDSQKILNSVSLTLSPRDTTAQVLLTIPQLAIGRNEVEIELISSVGESDLENNRQVIRIWGRETQLNVLVIEQEPRWEYRHLKSVLERDRNLSVSTFLLEGDPAYSIEDRTALTQLPKEIDQFDAVILGDLDFNLLPSEFEVTLEEFVEKEGGLLLLSGERAFTTLDLTSILSELHPAIAREKNGESRQPVKVRITPEGQAQRIFPLLVEETRHNLPELYPLNSEISLKPSSLTLLKGQSTQTSFQEVPLVMSMRYGSGVVMQHLVDDIWRWKALNRGEFFRKYWAQTIRNLCRQKLLEDLPPIELTTNRDLYQTHDPVQIYLFDRQQQFVEQDKIPLIWKQNDELGGEVTLERSNSDETLFSTTLNGLATGEYSLSLPDAIFPKSQVQASFEVVQSNIEDNYFPLQESFLRNLSKKTNGKFYFPWQLEQLPVDLPERQFTSNSEQLIIPVWNRWELLLPIFALFSMEWIIRRRSGLD